MCFEGAFEALFDALAPFLTCAIPEVARVRCERQIGSDDRAPAKATGRATGSCEMPSDQRAGVSVMVGYQAY